jgi:hypothetical protein
VTNYFTEDSGEKKLVLEQDEQNKLEIVIAESNFNCLEIIGVDVKDTREAVNQFLNSQGFGDYHATGYEGSCFFHSLHILGLEDREDNPDEILKTRQKVKDFVEKTAEKAVYEENQKIVPEADRVPIEDFTNPEVWVTDAIIDLTARAFDIEIHVYTKYGNEFNIKKYPDGDSYVRDPTKKLYKVWHHNIAAPLTGLHRNHYVPLLEIAKPFNVAEQVEKPIEKSAENSLKENVAEPRVCNPQSALEKHMSSLVYNQAFAPEDKPEEEFYFETSDYRHLDMLIALHATEYLANVQKYGRMNALHNLKLKYHPDNELHLTKIF